MITQCPSCHTHFRVHAEQLAARAGQVRCGRCSRIFDALEYLIEQPVQARAPTADEAAAAPVAATSGELLPPSAPPQTAHAHVDVPPPAVAAGAASLPESGWVASEPALSALPEFEPGAPAGGAADVSAFDFGPDAAAQPAGRARRWPWLLGALLLLALLLAQAAYYYRSALIVLLPQAKPYAAELCARLRCDLPLPRRVDLISIEASDLQADTTNPNVMVLSATLKNRAVFDQQLPLLELTLTDAQDQPVVRRVLSPGDYMGKGSAVAASFAANSEIAVKVFIEGSQIKATGYRLYLFYP